MASDYPPNAAALAGLCCRRTLAAGLTPAKTLRTIMTISNPMLPAHLVPAAPVASRRALLMGLAASAAIPVPAIANAVGGLAASAEPDWRDAELLSLYAAVLKQSDIYEKAERAHDRLCFVLRDQTVFAAPRHKEGDPVDGVAWWCSEEGGYVGYCHPGQIEDRRDRLFFGWADRDRFAEILVAHDRHQALRAEAGARLGVDAAEAEADTEFARLRDLENKLVAMPAFTLEGMRARAMVVFRVCWGSEAEFTTDYGIAASIVCDLVGRAASVRPGAAHTEGGSSVHKTAVQARGGGHVDDLRGDDQQVH